MKKYNALFVVAITVLVVTLLTWILPVTYLNGELMEAERARIGLINFFNYPIYNFFNFIYIFLYLIFVGGLYGVLNKTGAYRLILDRVTNHIKGREVLTLILTVLLLVLVISFTGFTFEALLILPFIASIVLLLGYDKLTAGMITIGSISVGIIGTTFSSVVAGTFNTILGTNYQDLIWVKVGLLVLCSAILIVNVILHARKIEKTKNVEEGFLIPEKVKDKDIKVWPLATLLIAFIVVCIISVIDWTDAFGINFFDNMHTAVMAFPVMSRFTILGVCLFVVLYNVLYSLIQRRKEHKKEEKKTLKKDEKKVVLKTKLMTTRRMIVTIVFGVIGLISLAKILLEDVFGATNIISQALEAIKVSTFFEGFTWERVIGSAQAFGNWTYNDFMGIILMVVVIIKFMYHISFSEIVSNYGNGIKNVLYGAIVAILGYTVLIIISSHPIILTILKPILELTDGLSILWYPIATFVSALCNTDFTYYKYGALTLEYATTYFSSAEVYPLCELITQTMYGLALMVAPTSSVLLFGMCLLDIRYLEWLKKMWRPILEIVLVIFISFIIVLQFLI